MLRRHPEPGGRPFHGRHPARVRGPLRRGRGAAQEPVSRPAGELRHHEVAPAGRRAAHADPRGYLPAAARRPRGQLRPVQAVQRRPAQARPLHRALRPSLLRAPGVRPRADRRGRARERDREALHERGHVLRRHQRGGARGARHRDEPPGRQVQHGRGRREPHPRDDAAERRLHELRDQAGRVRALWRDEPLPEEREGDPDQDGPGREARTGRKPPRQEGLAVGRGGQELHARRRPDLAPAPPRHLLHRGPGGAHLRPEEREPRRHGLRQARERGRSWHDRDRRREGRSGQDLDLRRERRHGFGAARLHLPCGTSPGAWPCRDAADAASERPALPRGGRGRLEAHGRP